MRVLTFIAVLALALLVQRSDAMYCKTNGGRQVGWWVVLKVPGTGNYMYADATNPSLKLASQDLKSPDYSAVSRTLKQVYANSNNAGYVMYNDQLPNGKQKSSRAHAKGVIGFDQGGGFWMLHSVPRYPDWVRNGPYKGYPDYALKYAQSFLCVSLSVASMATVGVQLQYYFPGYYDWKFPAYTPPSLMDAVNGAHVTPAASNVQNLFTVGAHADGWRPTFTAANASRTLSLEHCRGLARAEESLRTINMSLTAEFGWRDACKKQELLAARGEAVEAPLATTLTSFAKNKKWGKDIYEYLFAPYYNTDMKAETWMNGINPMPTYCRPEYPYSVMNIRTVNAGGVAYKQTKDHSKWAIGANADNPVMCIGGINRQMSQVGRQGGGICIRNPTLWASVNKMITSFDHCN